MSSLQIDVGHVTACLALVLVGSARDGPPAAPRGLAESYVDSKFTGGSSPAPGARGADKGSQRMPTLPDSPRLARSVSTGEKLSVRLPQTAPDTLFVAGG